MSKPLSVREKLARELYRWEWQRGWKESFPYQREHCFREADRILKMLGVKK